MIVFNNFWDMLLFANFWDYPFMCIILWGLVIYLIIGLYGMIRDEIYSILKRRNRKDE